MSEKLEMVLERIVNKLEELDKRLSKLERGKTEKEIPKKSVIETSKFTTSVNKAKKGVGIVMRFPKFVKIVNNTVYIVLNEDEAVRYVKSLYREVMSIVNDKNGQSSESTPRQSYKKKSSVKIVEE